MTKKVAMKEMLIWYFLKCVSLTNIKRVMKMPFQANVRVISCPPTRARVAGPQQRTLTFASRCSHDKYGLHTWARQTETRFTSFLFLVCLDTECHFKSYTSFFSTTSPFPDFWIHIWRMTPLTDPTFQPKYLGSRFHWHRYIPSDKYSITA